MAQHGMQVWIASIETFSWPIIIDFCLIEGVKKRSFLYVFIFAVHNFSYTQESCSISQTIKSIISIYRSIVIYHFGRYCKCGKSCPYQAPEKMMKGRKNITLDRTNLHTSMNKIEIFWECSNIFPTEIHGVFRKKEIPILELGTKMFC